MFFIYASEEAIGFLYQKLTMETADILSGLQISISGGGNPVSFAFADVIIFYGDTSSGGRYPAMCREVSAN